MSCTMNKKLTDYSIETKPLKYGWKSHTLPLDVPDEAFGTFKPVIQLWRKKITNDADGTMRMPAWKSFRFQEFKGWHQFTCLSEIDEKKFIPKLRIVPTGVVNLLKEDHTGQTVDKMVNIATKAEISEHFSKLAKGPHIGLTAGLQPVENSTAKWFESLELPLTLNGNKIEQFIHAVAMGHEPT